MMGKSPTKTLNANEVGEIASWFEGRTIFVTGGTGLMGKVLIEKLLYSCPGINRIYVLMRAKRGKSPEVRLEEMWKLPMFVRLRENKPEAIKKIVILNGDVVSENLGLSLMSRARLHAEVSVVFHCAATLKLEATLKDAIDQNTAGTARVIQICKEIKQLCSFVHLSTAFCCCDIQELEEKVYPTKDNPSDIISAAAWLKPDALEAATKKLIEPHPNTYTYSKRLAETLIAEQFPEMPVCIVRPSIVTPAWEEPIPGWVDNLNGPVGILVGAGKGVIRTMHCKGECHAQVIPVDLAINGLIAIAWKTSTVTPKPREIPVYNMTQDGVKRMTWGEVLEHGRFVGRKYPFEMCLWYPDGNIRSSQFIHSFFAFFLHFLPAYFIDFLMFIFMQKRFMVRIYKRIAEGLELLQFFTTREWIFESSKFLSLWNEMGPEDRKRFPIDFEIIEVHEYLKRCILGARQYCMKEDLSSIPKCRIQHMFLWLLDRTVALAFYAFIGYLVFSYSATARLVLDSVGNYVHEMPLVRNIVAKAY